MKTTMVNRAIIAAGIFTLIATASVASASIDKNSLLFAAKNGYIDVEVNGSTITLTGFVESVETRLLAEAAAKAEGYQVINQLMVPSERGVGFF